MLVLHGAVPFLLNPTLAQAVWSLGFSQSFANQSLWTVYATNFGAPEPAAMAFGLPGAWLAGVYIQLGLKPPDAYSAMVASWMTLAMGAAYRMARHFSVGPALAALGALGWMSMPVTWAHAGYSMLSIGIALLPLYFLCFLKLLEGCAHTEGDPLGHPGLWRLAHLLSCILAVFMDGYSFMFFAVGSSLLGAWWWLTEARPGRKRLTLVALPLHMAALVTAYLLYGAFIGKSGYSPSPLDFFRGWGVDLSFLVRPTTGVHWLSDALGWSVARSGQQYFGDASVWVTTFALPVIGGSIWATWRIARMQRAALAFVLMGIFGFYMAMGPSIKLNSVKAVGVNAGQLMPAEAALAPTGSGWLSEQLPGFRSMRASYRWTALGVFGAWGLLLLTVAARADQRTRVIGGSLMAVVVLFNLPNLPIKLSEYHKNRNMFFQIEADLVNDMREVLNEGERVAFLPWGNDFLVNYLAARLKVVSYNVGGDKNLESARSHWPYWMGQFPKGVVDAHFADRIQMLLASREADVVVLPYIDMLGAAHFWPYPHKHENQVRAVANQFGIAGPLTVIERKHYMVVRPNLEFRSRTGTAWSEELGNRTCLPPLCMQQVGFDESSPTQSGVLSGNRLTTHGHGGFLLYGPHVEMKSGEYILTIHGVSPVHTDTWVDVASSQGALQHGRFLLAPKSDHVLLETLVTLPTAVDDLEVRVFAGPQDQVALEGIKLQPTTRSSPPEHP